ncbi:hypothetical protein [Cupriavidus pauculus]|uniref:hypothetical protein n=1 Tax=Cupriavidus pauculus TaxID=82633 RepID=UPI0030F6631D
MAYSAAELESMISALEDRISEYEEMVEHLRGRRDELTAELADALLGPVDNSGVDVGEQELPEYDYEEVRESYVDAGGEFEEGAPLDQELWDGVVHDWYLEEMHSYVENGG